MCLHHITYKVHAHMVNSFCENYIVHFEYTILHDYYIAN